MKTKENPLTIVMLVITTAALAVMIGVLLFLINKTITDSRHSEPVMDKVYQCDQCGWEPQPAQQLENFCYHCGDAITEKDIIGEVIHSDIVYDTGEYESFFICPECYKQPDTTHRCGIYCPYCGSKMQYKG